MKQVEIRALSTREIPNAARVLSRGMRDNPILVQVFGADAGRRERSLRLMFAPVLSQRVRKGIVLGAFISAELVGVAGMLPPRYCQATKVEKMTVLLAVIRGSGLQISRRVLRWVDDWSQHDSPISHWHLGPVAVDRPLQGQGIGSALLGDCCRRIDQYRSAGYLETDKPENVTFYKRFDFEVIDEHLVLGIKNWFMLRVSPG